MTMTAARNEPRHEVLCLLGRIEALVLRLRSHDQRGGPDVDLMERELERLRWRLAAAARRSASRHAGAVA
jgi:hypothetical protein